MSSQEKEFYKELDSHRREPSAPKRFTLTKLLVVFVIILALCEGTLFYIGYSLKKAPVEDATVVPTIDVNTNFSRVELNDSEYQIVVSEGILCGKIFASFKRDLSCQISSDGIVIAGKISSILPSNASIVFMPKVNNGNLDFEVARATIGTIKIPDLLTYGIKNVFRAVINNQTKGISIKRVDLEPSIMVIIANK